MRERIFNVFFREKPAQLLIEIKKANGSSYAATIAKKVDCTYTHVVKLLQKLEKAGIILFERQGRLKKITLTKKGEELASYIENSARLL